MLRRRRCLAIRRNGGRRNGSRRCYGGLLRHRWRCATTVRPRSQMREIGRPRRPAMQTRYRLRWYCRDCCLSWCRRRCRGWWYRRRWFGNAGSSLPGRRRPRKGGMRRSLCRLRLRVAHSRRRVEMAEIGRYCGMPSGLGSLEPDRATAT
jgi:hypothetical protein